MSKSTFIRFSAGDTAIEFTYGSSHYAEVLGVLSQVHLRGEEARALIRSPRWRQMIPELDSALVFLVLNKHESSFSEEDRKDYSLSYNSVHLIVKCVD